MDGVAFSLPVKSIFPDAVKAFNDERHEIEILGDVSITNKAGWIGMRLPVYCSPTNVYFGKIEVRELPTKGNATDYFLSEYWDGKRDHQGDALSSEWLQPVLAENEFGKDRASIPDCPAPWGCGGTLEWNIPNVCRATVDGVTQEHIYSHSVQLFSITSDGTVEVSKFGMHVRRSVSGQISLWSEDASGNAR